MNDEINAVVNKQQEDILFSTIAIWADEVSALEMQIKKLEEKLNAVAKSN